MPASAAIFRIFSSCSCQPVVPMTTFIRAGGELRKILSNGRRDGELDGDIGIGRRRNADAADVVRVVEMPDHLEPVVGRKPLDDLPHSSVADE